MALTTPACGSSVLEASLSECLTSVRIGWLESAVYPRDFYELVRRTRPRAREQRLCGSRIGRQEIVADYRACECRRSFCAAWISLRRIADWWSGLEANFRHVVSALFVPIFWLCSTTCLRWDFSRKSIGGLNWDASSLFAIKSRSFLATRCVGLLFNSSAQSAPANCSNAVHFVRSGGDGRCFAGLCRSAHSQAFSSHLDFRH